MRADQSETRRPRLPTASSGVPLITSDSQQAASKINGLDNNSSNNINPKRPVLTMHRTPNKPSSSLNASNTGTPPTTPRLGYKASQATLSQGTPAAPRSPRPTVKREAGSADSAASTVAPRRISYVGPQVRPSSSMSTVSNARTEIQSGTQSLRVRSTNDSSRQPTSPKFFHASDTKVVARRSLQPTIAGDVSQPQAPRLQSQSSKFFHASEATNSSQTYLSPRLPTTAPVTNQQTPITTPQHLSSLNSGRNVKFIYANGVEEVLEPRRKNPSTSEGSSRPPSPNPYPLSPGPILSPSKPSTSSASSVLSSPSQRVSSSADRRASLESKVRHGRALSIGGGGAVQEVFLVPEALRSPIAPPRVANGDEPAPAANPMVMTLKMREELAANARRERKVMDLEISNASLLAINRTLERRMKKQTSELRRYRRLARTGELQPKSTTEQKKSRTSTEALENEGHTNEDAITENVVGEEEDDQDDDEDEEDEESSSGDDTKSYKGKRALVHSDKDKVSAELQKHQALLDASVKTDALLVRCQFMIEEMMKEAKKALDYKIKASDVKIGGRILRSDDEEEEDNDDGEGVGVFVGGEVTETEAEDEVTETEEESTDGDGDFDEDEDDEDEGNVTETEDELDDPK